MFSNITKFYNLIRIIKGFSKKCIDDTNKTYDNADLYIKTIFKKVSDSKLFIYAIYKLFF
jgi:hypothetical protein